MTKVAKLKTPGSDAPPTADQLTARYRDSIQGTALEAAIEEQARVAWEVEAVLRMAAIALEGVSAEIDGPNYELALQAAAARLYNLGCNLEGGPLIDRAIEIARARETDAQGGAA